MSSVPEKSLEPEGHPGRADLGHRQLFPLRETGPRPNTSRLETNRWSSSRTDSSSSYPCRRFFINGSSRFSSTHCMRL